MTRSELRKNIFKIIFGLEFHPDEAVEEQVELRLDSLKEDDINDKDLAYIADKAKAIIEVIPELDEVIGMHSKK